jgi:Protein of unknown function (DUF2809)
MFRRLPGGSQLRSLSERPQAGARQRLDRRSARGGPVSGRSRAIRLVALAAAAGFVATAIGIRYLGTGRLYSNGPLEQDSGTALYAAAVYAGVLFLVPRIRPVLAGAIALTWCWLVELAQLTSIPASLSARNVLLRLLLGTSFDWTDMLWYPIGIAPVLLAHLLIQRTQRQNG